MRLKYLLKICTKRLRKHFKLLLLFGVMWLFLSGLVLHRLHMSQQLRQEIRMDLPHILWWNIMIGPYLETRYCGPYKCMITSMRQKLPDVSAVLFYASQLLYDDFPLPRLPSHLWALYHEESPRNVPFIPFDNMLKHFNFTATFSRYSDFPLTLQYLPGLEDLTADTYMLSTEQKTQLRGNEHLAAVAFIQSDCDTMSGREHYVKQLMQHIPIDSYGKCLHNRDLPAVLNVDHLNNMFSAEMLKFLGQYKFIIAIENGVCQDYITEKYWRPLIVGALPIYFGSPSIRDWEPNEKSTIHIADFASPKALAEFLKQLEQNDTEYNTYLRHKYDLLEPISNRRLLQQLLSQGHPGRGNSFRGFECAVCRQLYEKSPLETQMASVAQYNCTLPLAYPPMDLDKSTTGYGQIWVKLLTYGRCAAMLLDWLLQRNQNYTRPEFDTLLNSAFEANDCN